jgi:hypothetical protein|tara:strand:+ start:340 stop:465 length:126 start_codon:yes stop_codon:yes gene_type:complete
MKPNRLLVMGLTALVATFGCARQSTERATESRTYAVVGLSD